MTALNLTLDDLAREQRIMEGEQIHGPWNAEQVAKRDPYTRFCNKLASGFNFLEAFETLCVDDGQRSRCEHLRNMLREVYSRASLLNTSIRSENNDK